MIAHKFPGIQLDLTSVEVIWLHFTRFFMDLEANFDSSMHVFKEPTGVYYKLTGNYSPKILDEAKQKTINYVQKNKIEMLSSELEYKHYMNICQELRQRFPKIYIQLLHYNVFDYVSRRLHQKFGYKQALQDYQELIKKKKRFCYLICDKAYFVQIKEIFYQLADPIEKQTSGGVSSTSLKRTTSTSSTSNTTTSTTLAPSSTLQQQNQQNPSTQHNRSSSTAVVAGLTNNPINISNQDEINIHNFEEPSSPHLALEMKMNSMYDEDDYNQYSNQANLLSGEGSENFKGLDIQKEDFPCLSDAQILINQQQLLNDSGTSNSNGGSSIMKSEAQKKKSSKKQKKSKSNQKSTQIILAKVNSQSSSGIISSLIGDSTSKEQSHILQKASSSHQYSSSSSNSNQYYSKNEQFDEWDFELPTYKITTSDQSYQNKSLSQHIQEESQYYNFSKTTSSNQKQNPSEKQQNQSQQSQPSQIDLKNKSLSQGATTDQKIQNSTSGVVKKEGSTTSQNQSSQQVPQKKNSVTLTQQNSQPNASQTQAITEKSKPSQVTSEQQQSGEKGNISSTQSTSAQLNVKQQQQQSIYQQKDEKNQIKKSNDVEETMSYQQQQIEQQSLKQFNMMQPLYNRDSFNLDQSNNSISNSQSQQQSLTSLYTQNYTYPLPTSNNSSQQKKKEDQTGSEQSHKEMIINQAPILMQSQLQSHPPGLSFNTNLDDLSLLKQYSEQSIASSTSSQILCFDEGSKTKIGDTQSSKSKITTELSEKQQKMMKSIKSEPFNPNKASISLRLDAIVIEQDFKTEALIEKQRIYADEFSETIRIMYKENQYCLKIFKNLSAYNLRKVNIYIEHLKVLAAPRLIRSYGKTVTCLNLSFDLMLLLDYKEKNLLQAVKQKMIVSFNDKLLVFWQIIQAIQHIHSHLIQENMIHGNLKPENVLLNPKKKVFLQDIYVLKNRENKYRPKNEGLTQSADIWSLGLITYFIFTDHLIDTDKAMYLISEQVLLNQIYKPGNSDIRVIYNLIEKMLDLNPTKRPDIEEIVSHLKPIIQKKNKELSSVLNVQSTAFENIPHISQQNSNTLQIN